jgi:hypothetical protein
MQGYYIQERPLWSIYISERCDNPFCYQASVPASGVASGVGVAGGGATGVSVGGGWVPVPVPPAGGVGGVGVGVGLPLGTPDAAGIQII